MRGIWNFCNKIFGRFALKLVPEEWCCVKKGEQSFPFWMGFVNFYNRGILHDVIKELESCLNIYGAIYAALIN